MLRPHWLKEGQILWPGQRKDDTVYPRVAYADLTDVDKASILLDYTSHNTLEHPIPAHIRAVLTIPYPVETDEQWLKRGVWVRTRGGHIRLAVSQDDANHIYYRVSEENVDA